MSKSLDNYIAIEEPANDMYGKLMSIADTLISDYFELLTDVSEEELKGFKGQLAAQSINPMVLKKRLAREIVSQFHSDDAALAAEAHFEKVVQQKEIPDNIPEMSLAELTGRILKSDTNRDTSKGFSPVDIISATGMAKSKGEAKRLISQGAVEIDGKRINDDVTTISLVHDTVIKVGKRSWVKITTSGKKP